MKKILAVDDNKEVLQVVEILLEMRGYEVMTIWEGEKVVQAVKDFSPDLILLDIFLGGFSGIEICNEIKSNPETKNTCIIMFSAHAKREDVLKLCPANGFISKPFDIHTLTKIIADELGKCD